MNGRTTWTVVQIIESGHAHERVGTSQEMGHSEFGLD